MRGIEGDTKGGVGTIVTFYNTVLIPPENLAPQFMRYAANFLAAADGYLLSEKVLPHITVCQFETNREIPDCALDRTEPVKFSGFNIRAGIGIHDGYSWFEMLAVKTPSLTSLQKHVANILAEGSITPLTKLGDDYSPHVTFCRVKKKNVSDWSGRIPDIDFCDTETLWRYAVGVSDRNGQLLRLL